MKRVLLAGFKQETSSFNPTPTLYQDFIIQRGDELIRDLAGTDTEFAAALDIFADQVEVVPTYAACSISSGGPVATPDLDRLIDELVDAVRPHTDVDGAYIVFHGAMAGADEVDPEGRVLAQVRQLLGDKPIVISLDMHGILTDRLEENADLINVFHTYPHIDQYNTGERAATNLLRLLDGAKPTKARIKLPMLVRGDELITATGIFGEAIRSCQAIEASPGGLAASVLIGNPFTDVPELCSQAIVVTDNDPEAAQRAALEIAEDFWPKRATMQAPLVSIEEAIAGAKKLTGTAIFADAADATSSGASGDSNALLAALVDANYTGKALLPLVDAPAVQRAKEIGLGQSATFSLGGTCDPRFKPIALEATVTLLATGPYFFESWGNEQDAGDTAVLQAENFTIIVTTLPVYLFDRSLFLAHGRDPKNFDLVVVKSPHCQDHFFVEWAEENFNIDAPGSTSANLKSLGHTICQRPMYPLDEDAAFEPVAQVFSRDRA